MKMGFGKNACTFLVINNEIKYNGYYKSCDRRKLHEQLSEPGKLTARQNVRLSF